MADENGRIPSTGDPRVDAALERIRGKFQDPEDAMLVQVMLERKAGERIKEHAEILASHDAWLKKHDEVIQRIEINLAEITEKVNLLFDREGGPEAR
jgi:hypothetical protein